MVTAKANSYRSRKKGKFGENRLAWRWMEKILKHTEFGQHLNQQINQLWRTPWTASPDNASPPPGLTPHCCRPCIRPKLSQLVLSILKVFMRARSCQWRFSWGCFAAQGRSRARPWGSTPWMTTVIIKNLNIRTSNSYCVFLQWHPVSTTSLGAMPWVRWHWSPSLVSLVANSEYGNMRQRICCAWPNFGPTNTNIF